MPVNNVHLTPEQQRSAEELIRLHEERVRRESEREAARTSEERRWIDGAGIVWRYAVLDGASVRVVRCEGADPGAAAGSAEDPDLHLSIPDEIAGLPVTELADDACSRVPGLVEVACPATLRRIGLCAFRDNPELHRAVLPPLADAFDVEWFRSCPHLEELVLPGQLPAIDAGLFDLPSLRALTVGPGTSRVVPGAFEKSALSRIEVCGADARLSTDGTALFAADGSKLIALAVPRHVYRVPDGVRIISKKAFCGRAELSRVELPASVEQLGDFALARTGIVKFTAPASLQRVGEKALFGCEQLIEVQLNDGLRFIERDAFSATRLGALFIPATVEALGYPLAAGAPLRAAGPSATLFIDSASPFLRLDEAGGLYRRTGEGWCFARLVNPDATSYDVAEGTQAIDDGAFAGCGVLTQATLPEGLVRIGSGAFRGCRALKRADLPSSVEEVGSEAFLDTSLVSVRLPAGLARIGALALVTQGAHYGKVPTTMREVSVAEGNPRFYVTSGLLVERGTAADGGDVALLCAVGTECVQMPAAVTGVATYALSGLSGVRELVLSDRIRAVGPRGLALASFVDLIRVELAEPLPDGRDRLELRYPRTDRGAQQQALALSVPSSVSVPMLFERYDNAVVCGCSFDAASDGGLTPYEQATRIVARLQDPVFLSPVNRSLAERQLGSNVAELCADIARHDDRGAIDALLALGFLNEDNLDEVIERVGAVQDAAMTGYLLEVKRRRFGRRSLDFDL